MPAIAGWGFCIFISPLYVSYGYKIYGGMVTLLSRVIVVTPNWQHLNPKLLERYPSKISQQLQGAPFSRRIYY